MDFRFKPIAFIQSPFKTKFGVPRQAGLALAVESTIKFNKDARIVTALKGLDQFTHIWVIFVFDQHGAKDWVPSIRPPRLGGKEKMGVLASRSPHRPNPIGLSAVEIKRLDLENPNGAEVIIKGGDFVDGTPVLDIKPYIPYADMMENAESGWAHDPIQRHLVTFTEAAEKNLKEFKWSASRIQAFKEMVSEVLGLDPRPAYLKGQFPVGDEKTFGQNYGIELGKVEIKYSIEQTGFQINSLEEV